MENEIIKERFLGTIFGQAVGDALGLSTEFMSKQEVDRFYPNGKEDYSQIVQDDHRRRWQRGDWTDDTEESFFYNFIFHIFLFIQPTNRKVIHINHSLVI